MKSILFVRGFATALSSGDDSYLHLKIFLQKTYEVVYFDYEPSEDMRVVYKRLCSIIEKRKFDILMAHSLGAGMVSKYLKSNLSKISSYDKIILLMPFICKKFLYDFTIIALTTQLWLNPNLIFPKALFASSMSLYEDGNLLNDDFSLISFKQPFDLYSEKETAISNDVSFILDNPNITLFYASNEQLNIIDESVLKKINSRQLKRVNGRHECWRSIKINKDSETDFFTQLDLILTTK